MKAECFLVEKNYGLIEKVDFFKQLEVDDNKGSQMAILFCWFS
jgi:hypothetical protein